MSLKTCICIAALLLISHSALASQQAITCTEVAETHDGKQAALIAQMRATVETEKLFTAQSTSGVDTCAASFSDGEMTLNYRFQNGGTFQVKRNDAIEFSEQSVTLPAATKIDLVTLLKDAEHHAFAPDGCNIDWRHGAQEKAEGATSVQETVYRGTTCNCQARVRRDLRSKWLYLILRSTC